jgi:predicted ATPase
VGIATGPVVVGDIIGEGASQESAVVGETPNLAARLQAAADIGSVVLGVASFNLAGGRFEYEDLGTRPMKGIAEPVQVWKVIRPSDSVSRFEAMHKSGLTPLIGRQHETGLLLERWQYVKEGDGQVVFFSGEAGIGKSRIIESLCTQIDADNPLVVRYQCSAYHESSALRPVIEQLERVARTSSADSSADKLEKLASLTSGAEQQMPIAPQIIANLLSIPTGDRYPPLRLAPEQVKEATFEALVAQIEAGANSRPVLILFEDVHWSDPTSLEFIGQLVTKAQTLPWLLMVTFRLEFTPPWDGPSHITSLRLNRLSRSRAIEVIEGVPEGKSISPQVREQIIEKSDGVPLFLEELTRAVIETMGKNDRADGEKLHQSAAAVSVPGSLQDSLMARLDRSASMREVAQIAAVIGREFSLELLIAVSELGIEALHSALNLLIDAALVFPKGPRHYIFKHALVQDAAYQSLLKAKRKSLHASIANALEQEFAETAENDPELIAHHFSEAGLDEQARQYWMKAGRRSIRQNAHDEAASQFERCLSLIESIADDNTREHQEIEIRVALGVSLVGKEGGASATVRENYDRALELCLRLGEVEHQYPVLWGLWFHHLMSSDLSAANQLAERLLEFSESLEDEALVLESHHCQWAVKYLSGDLKSALEHCDAGIEIYRPQKHHALTHTYGGHDPGACGLSVSGLSLWLLGYPEQSHNKLMQADSLANELNHTRTLANTLRMSLLVCALGRDLAQIDKKARELDEFAQADEMLDNLKLATGLLGWVAFCQGDEEEGIAMIRGSLNQWIEQRTPWTAVPISLAAEALGKANEVAEALRLVEDTISVLASDDVQWPLAELYRIKAGLLLKQDVENRPGAEAAFHKSMEIARLQNAKSLELRASLDFARYCLVVGREEQAYKTLKPVFDWFSEGFDSAELKQAKSLLAELAQTIQ